MIQKCRYNLFVLRRILKYSSFPKIFPKRKFLIDAFIFLTVGACHVYNSSLYLRSFYYPAASFITTKIYFILKLILHKGDFCYHNIFYYFNLGLLNKWCKLYPKWKYKCFCLFTIYIQCSYNSKCIIQNDKSFRTIRSMKFYYFISLK